jgi:hypothetical protein
VQKSGSGRGIAIYNSRYIFDGYPGTTGRQKSFPFLLTVPTPRSTNRSRWSLKPKGINGEQVKKGQSLLPLTANRLSIKWSVGSVVNKLVGL